MENREPMTKEYQISAHLVPALINGDLTGLTDDEEIGLDDFTQREDGGYCSFHWEAAAPYEPDNFGKCDALGVYTETRPVHLVIFN